MEARYARDPTNARGLDGPGGTVSTGGSFSEPVSRAGARTRQGHFSRTGSAGRSPRSPSARPCRPATVFDFPSRLARGRACALPEGKCWGFYPPAGPLQAALRLAPLIVPTIDFIQSARGLRRALRLSRRQHDRLLFRRSRDLPCGASHHPIGVGDAGEPSHVFPLGDAENRQQPAPVGAVRLAGRRQRPSVCGHFSRTGSADRSPSARPCRPATVFDFRPR
jgi:hypothetical protein